MSGKMKDSGLDWIGGIPETWETKKMKYIAKFFGGGTPSKENNDFWDGKIPWVSPKDMKNEIISTTEDTITVEGLANLSGQLIKPGAVLIVFRSGILKHTIPVAINQVEVALNQDMKAVVFDESIMTSRYFLRIVQGMNDVLLNQWVKVGATVDSIEHEYFANTVVMIPPIYEQIQITSFLDSRCEEIDAVISAKQSQNDLLKQQRQSIIYEAVTKGLDTSVKYKTSGVESIGEIPENWEVQRLKYLTKKPLQYGANETGEVFDEALPRYIRITDISMDNKLKEEGKLSLSLEKAQNYILQDGDVLFARSGATVGKSFYYSKEYGTSCFAGYLIRLSPDSSKMLGRFAYYFTLSNAYNDWTNMIFIQSTIQNISAEKYNNLFLPVPPIQEQRTIMDYLDAKCAEIDAIVDSNDAIIAKLKDYRQSIIYEVVTGKIAV